MSYFKLVTVMQTPATGLKQKSKQAKLSMQEQIDSILAYFSRAGVTQEH